MITEPHWTAYVTALMTPIVAGFGIWIAYQQWRTARDKLRLDLFDRRFAVYVAVREFFSSILTSGKISPEAAVNFSSATRDAKWLFDADVDKYLTDQVATKMNQLQTLRDELDGKVAGTERMKKIERQGELTSWFLGQFDALDKKMHSYLQLSNERKK